MVPLVVSVIGGGDLTEVVQGGEHAALAGLGQAGQQEVGVHF